MSENLNSYADSVLEGKIKNEGADTEAQIAGLDGRVSALEEGGSGGSPFIIELVMGENRLSVNKTWSEIYEQFHSGVPCYVHYRATVGDYFDEIELPVIQMYTNNDPGFYLIFIMVSGTDLAALDLVTSTENGYPERSV